MKKVAIIILALSVVTANAQEKGKSQKITNPKTMKTASGLEYTIKEKGKGKKPKVGDKVFVHYTGKFTNDTVFDSSVNRGTPFSFKLGAGQVIKGWDEAFLLLEVGDKATIKFGPELGYGDRASGAIPANSILIFDVELLSIVESPQAWDVKGKDTITMANGLKYMVIKENKAAAKASFGNNVTLHYSGFFKDGKGFDSSVEREQPFTVKMGSGQLIKALEDGIALMHKGDKVKFYIPYQLAYGEQGHAPAIPPKADLIFDIEILDVVPVLVPTLFDITGKEVKTTASGLKYYEIVKSNSPVKAAPGKTVRVHYSGYLADGKMFDSSVERGDPFEFVLGQAQVIPGWDEGIALMNVGDKLRLLIPYYLAYGEQGRLPMIPAKADLTFDVELMEVK
ncbi:MAG: FKBP-type peptidyl-prolyl cis-trans isomerase [Bacteroidota bacterium]